MKRLRSKSLLSIFISSIFILSSVSPSIVYAADLGKIFEKAAQGIIESISPVLNSLLGEVVDLQALANGEMPDIIDTISNIAETSFPELGQFDQLWDVLGQKEGLESFQSLLPVLQDFAGDKIPYFDQLSSLATEHGADFLGGAVEFDKISIESIQGIFSGSASTSSYFSGNLGGLAGQLEGLLENGAELDSVEVQDLLDKIDLESLKAIGEYTQDIEGLEGISQVTEAFSNSELQSLYNYTQNQDLQGLKDNVSSLVASKATEISGYEVEVNDVNGAIDQLQNLLSSQEAAGDTEGALATQTEINTLTAEKAAKESKIDALTDQIQGLIDLEDIADTVGIEGAEDYIGILQDLSLEKLDFIGGTKGPLEDIVGDLGSINTDDPMAAFDLQILSEKMGGLGDGAFSGIVDKLDFDIDGLDGILDGIGSGGLSGGLSSLNDFKLDIGNIEIPGLQSILDNITNIDIPGLDGIAGPLQDQLGGVLGNYDEVFGDLLETIGIDNFLSDELGSLFGDLGGGGTGASDGFLGSLFAGSDVLDQIGGIGFEGTDGLLDGFLDKIGELFDLGFATSALQYDPVALSAKKKKGCNVKKLNKFIKKKDKLVLKHKKTKKVDKQIAKCQTDIDKKKAQSDPAGYIAELSASQNSQGLSIQQRIANAEAKLNQARAIGSKYGY